ncbi:MAG: DUF4835 family protein [Bacteroidaceae bacterium]
MYKFRLTVLCVLSCWLGFAAKAQELHAKITINSQQVQGTSKSIFENLQSTLTEFVNDRQWTNQQYTQRERINCTFNITVNKYDETDNSFKCSLLLQSNRPVFNSTYTTTVFSIKDADFNFSYQEYDKLEFRADQINNDLTALIGYYVYLIIGFDMDTMAPLGGTEPLEIAMSITNNAQNLNSKGWKAFDDKKNRFAVINDYLDGGLETYRKMQYTYYRTGLDEMATNTERGRAAITEALGMLKTAHDSKPLSYLPQLFTEYKRDEFVHIYTGKCTAKEKEFLYTVLSSINASQNSYWTKMTK